jgi:chemotaxis protein CheC
MILTPQQIDALSELINIGAGRAANALSMLVSQRVLLKAPEVSVYPLLELETVIPGLTEQEIVNVHQIFRGKLAGDAMLLMDADSASVLVDMLSGGEGRPHPLNASDREALVETGNILLNAFMGSFGNLLRVHITFTVPHLQLESLREILTTLGSSNQDVEFALVVRIQFRLTQGDVRGYVIIVMGISSIETLVNAMRAEGFLMDS